MWAMLWIFTLSSKQWESINGFQPWCDRGTFVSKRSLGLPVEDGFVRDPAMLVVYQSTGSCRDTGKRGGSLRLRKREINSQIEIEVGCVINGVHVDWMREKRNVKSNYFLFSFFDLSDSIVNSAIKETEQTGEDQLGVE